MTRTSIICGWVLLASALAQSQTAPLVAPARPVTDDYFGIKVVDPYRYMENLSDPEVQTWIKSQADFSRTMLDAIPGRAAMLADIQKYVNATPASVGSVYRAFDGSYFFLKTLAGENIGKLYMRQRLDGADELLVDTDRFTGPKGEPPAISYYALSPDAHYLAYGVSQAGSEAATLHVMDVQTRKDLGGAIDRTEFGGVAWRGDNHSFFYNRLQELAPGQSPLDKYRNSKIYLHQLGDPPEQDAVAFGAGVSDLAAVGPDDEPFVETSMNSAYAVARVEHGVLREFTLYAAPIDTVGKPNTPWVKICDPSDGVTDYANLGDEIALMTHKDAPRFKVLQTSLAHPDLAAAKVVVTEGPTVLREVFAAADALYVKELDDGVYHILLLRVSPDGATARLPSSIVGTVDLAGSDPRLDGVIFSQTSWTTAVQYCRYVPVTNQVAPTNLQPAGPYDHLDDLTSEEVKAPSYDGTMIPLSIVHKKGMALDGKNPTILYAYGSYGSTQDPALGPSYIAWYERGGILAVAHVRGGGEGGEAWHQAGFKLTKPNTWRDFIACGEYLVSQKYTSPAQMGIMGGSAGGITVGRALTERPDLFAAASARAGVVNALRAGREPNGPPNVPEFGSDSTQAGFEDLYAMDALQHVRDGVAYPAVLLTTGINDPRVSPSEPAKFAARLQVASSSGKPVLLRVDYQGGHGIGASRLQSEELTADTFAFFLSQFGLATTAVNFHPDIEYGQAGGVSLKLDAAVPDGDGPFPVALLVHGGGWSGGDKARDITMLFDPLSKAHVVWFSINYRLSPKSQWPACYDDVRTAIRWVKAHATEYKGDPNRIALIGYSAGGELTCLAAAQAGDDTKVKAAVGISSPTDMVADTERRGGLSPSAKALLGLSDFDEKARKVLGEMSALNYVHAGMPPFLLIHGNADKSVPYEQSIHFQARLKAAGVPCDLVTIEQGPHDISKWAAIDLEWTDKIVKWILAND